MATIRISDLLDIVILSFAIYQLLWIMRRSSAGRVIKGVLVLIVAVGLADWLQLTATSWVLNKVVEWGILVLVICSSRRSAGPWSGWAAASSPACSSASAPSPSTIWRPPSGETVDAYTSMSKDKVGAPHGLPSGRISWTT